METTAPTERWTNRSLFLLLWPLIIEQILAVAIGMVDTAMVASVGEAAVSGVSLVDSINILLITAFNALATGGAVVVSQYIGRRDIKSASLAARQLVYVVTIVSSVIMLVTAIFCRQLLGLFYGRLAPDVIENAVIYFRISAFSMPFVALYNAGAALFRSMGNSRLTMLVALLVNIVNIGGNALLIYGLRMGVAGAAISTLVSRAVAAAVLIGILLRANSSHVNLRGIFKFKLDKEIISGILRVGVPNGLEGSIFQIGKLSVSRIVTTFGTAIIAGNAIAGVVASFAFLPGQAFAMATLTVVGQCIGAKDYTGAKKYVRKLLVWGYITITAVCILVLVILNPVLGLFSLSPEGREFAQSAITFNLLTVIAIWMPSFMLPSALRAAGDGRYTMGIAIFSMWLFRVGCAILFCFVLKLGPMGVWYAMLPDWIFRAIAYSARWARGKWQKKTVIK